MDTLFIYITKVAEFIALAMGIIVYKKLSHPLRPWVYFLAIVFVVEVAGTIIRVKNISNLWLYNSYLVIEVLFQLVFVTQVLKSRGYKIFVGVQGVVFLSVWLFQMTSQNMLNSFDKPSFVVALLVLFSVYSVLLYHIAMQTQTDLFKSPLLWFCISAILCYGWALIYFSVYDFLVAILTKKQVTVLWYSFNSMATLRYLLITYAFLLVHFSRKKIIH